LRPYARWLYEFLFAAFCANLYGSKMLASISGFWLENWLLSLVKSPPIIERGRVVRPIDTMPNPPVFLAAWLLLAILLFVCLRLLARFPVSEWLLRYVSPVIVIASPLYASVPFAPILQMGLLRWLEVPMMAAILLVYQQRKRGFAATAGTLVAIGIHLWLWGFAEMWTWGWRLDPERSNILWLLTREFAFLPVATILAWGLYIRLLTNSGSRIAG
jgi:hypothetical protein